MLRVERPQFPNAEAPPRTFEANGKAAAWRGRLCDVRGAFTDHALLIFIVAGYAALGIVCLSAAGFPAFRTPGIYMRLFQANLLFLASAAFGLGGMMLALHAGYVLLVLRSAAPVSQIASMLRVFASPHRLIQALPALLVLPVFISVFTAMKAAISWVQPFAWDSIIAELGWRLQGGYNSWELLHPVFGYPAVTHFLDVVYAGWFVVLYAIVFWQIFSTQRTELRMQFLLSLVLTWILLGSVCAVAFSSAGPCYFGRVVEGPDPYTPLMDYLHAVSREHQLIAVMAQDYLWQGYRHHGLDLFDGISAMPSMHIAMATLFALLGWRVSARLGAALTLFAVLIFIGSIELGWHYGLDGYAAALGTTAIWHAVGWVQRRAAPARRVPVEASMLEGAD